MWQMVALLIITAVVIGFTAYGIRERVRFGKLAGQLPPPNIPNRSNWYK